MQAEPSSDSPPIRVVLADDHVAIRRGLALLLESLPGIEVVGEADNGRQALNEVALHRPDVIVMDLRMPEVDGVEATRRIVSDFPATAVLVLTMFSEDTLVAEAIRAGARGYLLKTCDQFELDHALRAVAAGRAIFSSAVADSLLRRVSAVRQDVTIADLSTRERQILALLATGATNAAIAGKLFLSPKTVANHLSAVFTKLGVSSRGEAIVVARDAGLGRHD